MKRSRGETQCYFSAHKSGARLMNAFTLKLLHINSPVLAGRPVSQRADWDSPHHVWFFVCADVQLGATQVRGRWGGRGEALAD